MPNTNPSTQVASADQNDDLRTLRKQTQDGTLLVPAAGLKFVTDLGDPDNTTVASVSATGGITPGSGGLVSDSLTTNTATSETITSTVADGATAVAVILKSSHALADGSAKLLSVQNNGTEKLSVKADGTLVVGAAGISSSGGYYTLSNVAITDTAVSFPALTGTGSLKLTSFTDTSGTPGSGVANTTTGRSAFATTSTATITITNSRCATGDIVLCQLETNDATCLSMRAVCGNGSFTATPGAVTGGTTKFSWVVIKTA